MNAALPTITTVRQLIASGLAPDHEREALERVAERYAIAIPTTILGLMDGHDADDPILRQFVPSARELDRHPSEIADPIGDGLKSASPGVVHRYPDRVLLKIASVCPVYCRFCFRREMVGPENGEALSAKDLEKALAYIASDARIWEVILTGGDPFVLSARRIRTVTEALSAIPHVKILRWHTRVPVVDPARVTPEMVAALTASDKTVFVGLHTNHARELTVDARASIARLVDAGIPVVSQTVLLKGINDDADSLEALFRTLVEARVKPYYLHHGDLAPGTAHFRVPIEHGQALMRTLRRRLSGLALPTYVLDLPGAYGKVPLERFAEKSEGNAHRIEDAHARVHIYEDACTAPDTP